MRVSSSSSSASSSSCSRWCLLYRLRLNNFFFFFAALTLNRRGTFWLLLLSSSLSLSLSLFNLALFIFFLRIIFMWHLFIWELNLLVSLILNNRLSFDWCYFLSTFTFSNVCLILSDTLLSFLRLNNFALFFGLKLRFLFYFYIRFGTWQWFRFIIRWRRRWGRRGNFLFTFGCSFWLSFRRLSFLLLNNWFGFLLLRLRFSTSGCSSLLFLSFCCLTFWFNLRFYRRNFFNTILLINAHLLLVTISLVFNGLVNYHAEILL